MTKPTAHQAEIDARRPQILAAKRADAALGEALTPGGERERKRALYRQPGVTGDYTERTSRKQPRDGGEAQPPDLVWTWYVRDTAFLEGSQMCLGQAWASAR